MAGRTIAILGCGNMGTAIMYGLLSALKQESHKQIRKTTPLSKIIACVTRPESVTRLEHRFQEYIHSTSGKDTSKINSSSDGDFQAPECQIWQNNTVEAVKLADVVLLACQPSQAAGILSNHQLRSHLSNKLLLSICVGMSADHITRLIYNHGIENKTELNGNAVDERCYIVHAMPNMASTVRASATVLSISAADGSGISRSIPAELENLAEWIFSSIGTVTPVAPSLMNVASVTGASSVAFFASALEGVVKGAVAMGLSESDALHLAAQAMKGTAEMVLLTGTTGSKIREEVMTPNGCTARGVEVLRKQQAEEAFAEATSKAVERVFELGRGS